MPNFLKAPTVYIIIFRIETDKQTAADLPVVWILLTGTILDWLTTFCLLNISVFFKKKKLINNHKLKIAHDAAGHFSDLRVIKTPPQGLFALMLRRPALGAFPSSEVLPSVHWYCLFPSPGSTMGCQLLVLCSSLPPPSPTVASCAGMRPSVSELN